jgi:transcriptional regulator of arginine metabolism
MNPAARKQLVADLIKSATIASQEDLVKALKKKGVEVTQTTASRDLLEIGALRGKDGSGRFRYILGGTTSSLSSNSSRSKNLLLSVTASGNLVVAKTPPGGAQLLAGQIDQAIASGEIASGIGSIAGDDTVIVIAKTATGGALLAKELTALLDGDPVKSAEKKTQKKRSR